MKQGLNFCTHALRSLLCKDLIMIISPKDIQREIVARIEHERSIAEKNRELIRIYEEKVKKVIEKVWEG